MASGQGTRESGRANPDKLYRIGVLTALVYLLNCLFFIRGPQVYSRTPRELFTWFSVISLLYLFWKGYQLVQSSAETLSVRMIVGLAGVLCLLAFFIFPFHSTDVFGYINRGWQQVHYGQNPYVYRLADVPGWQQDPMMREHWLYNPVPYGFFFTLLARFLCQIGNGNWWLTLALFKAVNVLAYGFTAWFIWSIAGRLGQQRPMVALYSFLWNPLILMHHIANGHNDVLTGCLIALSMYLAVTGAGLWIIPVLVAATLLKYSPAFLIPLAFIFVVKKQGWKIAILSCLIGALICVLISAPYLKDWRLFRLEDIKDNATLIDNSLHSLLIHIFENIARLIPALAPLHRIVDTIIKTILRLGFLIFLAFQIIRIPRDFSAQLLIRKSTLILFVLMCVATSKFNAWYLAIVLPLALMLDEKDWLRRLVLLITCAELLSLTFFKQAYMLNYFAMILVPMWIIYRQERRARASAGTSIEELPVGPTLSASQKT